MMSKNKKNNNLVPRSFSWNEVGAKRIEGLAAPLRCADNCAQGVWEELAHCAGVELAAQAKQNV